MSRRNVIVFGIVFAAVAVGFLFLPVREWFIALQVHVDRLGALGPAVVAAAYVILTVLLIPGSALTIGAGTVFGLWTGLAVVVVGANLGALASFLLARTLLRDKVTEWAKANPRFDALDRAIAKEGFKMVLLSRLSPAFPFTLLNYLLGLTKVSVGSYALANLIGMLPGTFLYVYIGATLSSGLSEGASLFKQVLLGVGLLATVGVVVIVTRAAKRAIAEVEAGAAKEEPDGALTANS